MIQTIQNSDIATLLGLVNPDDQIEQQSVMSEIITSFALDRLLQQVDVNTKNDIESYLSSDNPGDDASYIMDKYPIFLKLIEEEAYSYKKGAIESQISSWEEDINRVSSQMEVPPIIQEFKDTISSLRVILNSDDSGRFDAIFEEYNQIKSKITQLQNE